ncbi:hypothetical protein QF040_003826 [Variovorax sp. W2I14]
MQVSIALPLVHARAAAGACQPKPSATEAASRLIRKAVPALPLRLALPLLFSSSLTATQAPRDSFQTLLYDLFT